MASENHVERSFSIRGRVQGVGFRWWTRRTAEEMGLSGAVKNLRDGTVAVRVRGPEEVVETFRNRLEDGPPGARVEGITEAPEGDAGLPLEQDAFRILH